MNPARHLGRGAVLLTGGTHDVLDSSQRTRTRLALGLGEVFLMTDVVIDLETLSTRPDAVVTAIGLGFTDGSMIYRPLHWGDQEGRHVDQSTVAWWMTQPDEARTQTHLRPDDPAGWDTEEALLDIAPVLADADHVWGDPPSFDLGILRSLYHHFGLPIPWSHRLERCCRTVRAGRPRIHSPEILHHAGHDALAAAMNLREWL